MTDTLSATQRAKQMSRIRGYGNQSTEKRLIALMREFHVTGWRRRAILLGKPDFVFRTERVALFVDGCFWHCCPRHRRLPKSKVTFWRRKLLGNIRRDRLVTRRLRARGWTVLRVWECALSRHQASRTLARIRRTLAKKRAKKMPTTAKVWPCPQKGAAIYEGVIKRSGHA